MMTMVTRVMILLFDNTLISDDDDEDVDRMILFSVTLISDDDDDGDRSDDIAL